LRATMSSSVYSESLHGSRGMPIFVLDNFRSAFNVGSVFRTAEAVSPAAVFLTGICCLPDNRKLRSTARGTQASVPWRYFEDSVEAVEWARASGRTVIAVENTSEAIPIWEAPFASSPAFLLGNEALGLDPALIGAADLCVFFPQSGARNCINVSSTAALVAFELQRRRFSCG
jgi:23S rRNA (guanosine2251-2'-O)-methyltransferase